MKEENQRKKKAKEEQKGGSFSFIKINLGRCFLKIKGKIKSD